MWVCDGCGSEVFPDDLTLHTDGHWLCGGCYEQLPAEVKE